MTDMVTTVMNRPWVQRLNRERLLYFGHFLASGGEGHEPGDGGITAPRSLGPITAPLFQSVRSVSTMARVEGSEEFDDRGEVRR